MVDSSRLVLELYGRSETSQRSKNPEYPQNWTRRTTIAETMYHAKNPGYIPSLLIKKLGATGCYGIDVGVSKQDPME